MQFRLLNQADNLLFAKRQPRSGGRLPIGRSQLAVWASVLTAERAKKLRRLREPTRLLFPKITQAARTGSRQHAGARCDDESRCPRSGKGRVPSAAIGSVPTREPDRANTRAATPSGIGVESTCIFPGGVYREVTGSSISARKVVTLGAQITRPTRHKIPLPLRNRKLCTMCCGAVPWRTLSECLRHVQTRTIRTTGSNRTVHAARFLEQR